MPEARACRVSWRHWYTDSRDNERDIVKLNNEEIMNQRMQWQASGCSNGFQDGDKGDWPNTWHNYPHSPACYKDYSVSTTCVQGENEIRFESQINQALNDEGWAFQDLKVEYGGSAANSRLMLGESVDVGQNEFNEAFWNSPNHIVKRDCDWCTNADYKTIFYK